MNRKKIALIAGSALLAAGLLTGAAFAATNNKVATPAAIAAAMANRLDQAVAAGKLTQAEADVLKQVAELRASVMEKLKLDSEAIIDQAVADGKITQERADQMKQRGSRGFGGPGGRFEQRAPFANRMPLDLGFDPRGLTQEELKAKLDEAVSQGKITQEQADWMLQHLNSPTGPMGGRHGGRRGGWEKGGFFKAPAGSQQDGETN